MSDVGAFVHTGPAETAPARRRWVGPVLVLVVLALVVVFTGDPPQTGIPFDPSSTDGLGARGIVDLLRELDVDVDVTQDVADVAGADSILVLPLGWDDPMLARSLAEGGARVVAAVSPGEEWEPVALGVGGFGLVSLGLDCPLLPDVVELRATSWPGWQLREDEQAPAGTERCLERGRGSWLVRVPAGAGELLAVGTLEPFLNVRLFDSDAARAAVRLLAPTGRERVVVLAERDATGDVTLTDLIDRRWYDAFWLSVVAGVLLVLARGRRLGRPVGERLPVRVPSGELARAIGDLRHRAGHEDRAAASLREHTLLACRRALGLPPDADAESVLAAVAASGQPVSPVVAAALRGGAQLDADGLVATARALAELRAAVTLRAAGAHATAAPGADVATPDPTT